jgi:hypothetical protein
VQKHGQGLVGPVRVFHGRPELFELHLSEGEENVVFAGEIIEKGAFADVSGIGDVFDGGFGKTLLGKESESGAEEAFTEFSAAALAAVG